MSLPRRTHGWREATRDPIYILQSKTWKWWKEPFGWEFVDDRLVPAKNFTSDELKRDWPEATYDDPDGGTWMEPNDVRERLLTDGEHCGFEWHVERVFFTREEGEAWATARAYNYPDGWRVYCICAEGDLAKLLKAQTDRSDEVPGM